jgi:hypothetical protein
MLSILSRYGMLAAVLLVGCEQATEPMANADDLTAPVVHRLDKHTGGLGDVGREECPPGSIWYAWHGSELSVMARPDWALQAYQYEVTFSPTETAYLWAEPGAEVSGWTFWNANTDTPGVVRIGAFTAGGTLPEPGQVLELTRIGFANPARVNVTGYEGNLTYCDLAEGIPRAPVSAVADTRRLAPGSLWMERTGDVIEVGFRTRNPLERFEDSALELDWRLPEYLTIEKVEFGDPINGWSRTDWRQYVHPTTGADRLVALAGRGVVPSGIEAGREYTFCRITVSGAGLPIWEHLIDGFSGYTTTGRSR